MSRWQPISSSEDAQRRLIAARLVHTLDHHRALAEVAAVVNADHDGQHGHAREQFEGNIANHDK